MCCLKIETPQLSMSLDAKPPETGPGYQVQMQVTPRQDFIGCLLTGAMAALPAFLEAFMRCLGGGSPGAGYTPGDRTRCDG